MAFTQSTFAPMSSQAAAPPRMYSYSSSDLVVDVVVAGYFFDKRHQLDEGDWILSTLGDGTSLLQVIADTSSVIQVSLSGLPVDNLAGGFADYNDLATASSPIAVIGGGAAVVLPNDKLGPFTNTDFLPAGVTSLWDSVGSTFDWSELKLGDTLEIRVELEVTTVSPNTSINVNLRLGTAPDDYLISYFPELNIKTAGMYRINPYKGIYMGDNNTLDNGGQFLIASDKDLDVIVAGWYVNVSKRGQ
tara:strand:- start:33 stop:770 length:738 start_codon:yes stop_codon:yes gene_type:complete